VKAGDPFLPCLENEGVEYVFGIPGDKKIQYRAA
jgi:thiamine pyrophosphate-dependent acetolactate synthase large subunit-like protein